MLTSISVDNYLQILLKSDTINFLCEKQYTKNDNGTCERVFEAVWP